MIFVILLIDIGLNPFHCCRDDSSDQDLAKRQRDEGAAGCASKVPHIAKRSTRRGVPRTKSDVKAVPFFCKESKDVYGCVKRRATHDSALEEGGNAYPLTRDIVKNVPANELGVTRCVGFYQRGAVPGRPASQ